MATIRIYTDGGARGNPGPAAAAFVALDEKGKILEKRGNFLGRKTNNVAEYHGVVSALSWALNSGIGSDLELFLDSQLIVNQLTGKFKIRQKTLQELAMKIKSLEKKIPGKISYRAVPRAKNRLADYLVNQTLDGAVAKKGRSKKLPP